MLYSFYRTGEERPIERYKARLKVQGEHRTLSKFKKNVIDFLGFNEQATKFGLGSFGLKRTVRSETTKDEAGALPPAAYAKPKPEVTAKVRFPDDQDDRTLPASSEINPLVSDVTLSFISDSNIPQVKLASAADFNEVEECESDSEISEVDMDSDSDLTISKPVVNR